MKLKPLATSVAVVAAGLASMASAGDFIEDSSLKIKFRNVYFNEMGRSDENTKDRREWVQAIIADFKSGYFADVIGFDLSAGGAMGLANDMDGEKNNCKNSNLPLDGGDKTKCDLNDIGGIHQAYAKFMFGLDNVEFSGNYGKKKRKFKTYSDSGSRALPAATFGGEGVLSIHDVDLYAAQITGFSPRNQSYFKDDLTNGSEKIDNLRIYGLKGKLAGVKFQMEQGASKDYLEQRYAQVGYDVDLNDDMTLGLDVRYGNQEDDGDLYGSQHESKFVNLNAALEMGATTLYAGYNKVTDGDWDTAYFDEDHGKWSSSVSLHEDFADEDEKTWLVGVSYDFAAMGVEGLEIDTYYARGEIDQSGVDESRWERGTILTYKFGGDLKGLDLAWENYTNRGHGGDSNTDDNRFYVNYSLSVF